MTDDRGLNRLIQALNLHPNLNTRTRYPTAGTRDLKISPRPILRPPVFFTRRFYQPRTAYRQALLHLIFFTNVSCGACLLVFQPPGSAV